jgi:S-adenosylmethionine/arginine decarboxylase-like enzyme
MSNGEPFGYSYHLDAYKVDATLCDNMELAYRFLEELVDRLGMDLSGSITVFHGPRKYGVELYPDKAGLTAFAPLITSGITLHTCNETGFLSLDVYSCKKFDKKIVLDYVRLTYNVADGMYEENYLIRGTKYHQA